MGLSEERLHADEDTPHHCPTVCSLLLYEEMPFFSTLKAAHGLSWRRSNPCTLSAILGGDSWEVMPVIQRIFILLSTWVSPVMDILSALYIWARQSDID